MTADAHGRTPSEQNDEWAVQRSRYRLADIEAFEIDQLRATISDTGMKGMRFTPRGYGGERRSPDRVKREGWQEQGVLAVAIDDERLTWPERELVRQLGDKLYGRRAEARP